MLSRATRVKLVVFAIVAVVSVVFVGGKYAGLDRLFGARGYLVTASLVDSGGIFAGAEVSYRGVTVGKVAGLELTDTGVDVRLDIDDNAPPIPADTNAVVANRSAVGEQYVDLRPEHENGPFLAEGSIIQQDRTGVPLSPDTVLASLDRLVSSVDTRSLRTVVDEAYQAFADAGPDMRVLLDTAHSFTVTARQNLPETRRLLTSGRTVLETQRRHGDDLTEFADGLKRISKQFTKSDADLRAVIDRAPAVSRQVIDFLDTSGSDFSILFANLLTTARITKVRVDSVEQLMVSFPVVGAFARTVSQGGRGQLGLVFDNFNPHSCTKGYETTRQRPADDVSEVEPNKQAYCAEPQGSPVNVRGAQNAPYRGRPVVVDPPEEQQSSGGAELPGLLGLPGSARAGSGMDALMGLPG